jgi:CheY-like chemotaxis protein
VDDDFTTLKILPAVLGVHFPDLHDRELLFRRFIFAKPSYIVISDIRMPGMNGLELLTRVNAFYCLATMPSDSLFPGSCLCALTARFPRNGR